MAKRVTQDYVETISPVGYVNNREITNLPGDFLVKGSKNTRIVNKEKVVSGKRYALKGAAKTVNSPIVSSKDWKTNTKVYRNIRQYMYQGQCETEVWFDNAWRRVKRGGTTAEFTWTEWWYATELIDVLLGVNGTDTIFMWSGGVAEVAAVTANTISKKGYITGTTFSFDATNRTISDSGSGFLTYGFAAGDVITVSGSTFNNGQYTIESVTAGLITLTDDAYLTTEAAGDTVIVKWAEGGTWAEARFLTAESGRSVRIGGITYTYTGGESTGTLTGLVTSPVTNGVVAGDYAMQEIMEFTPAAIDNRKHDLIAVQNNHVYYGSSTSRTVFVSKNTDFDDFAYTSPLRVPGEGYLLTLDSTPTALVPSEDDMYISAGDDDWYRIFMEFTADQGGESVIIRKLKTAPGQAAVGKDAVAYIKNNIAFLSVERTVDTLGNIENIENRQNVSISDDIKDDMEAYDVTGAHMLYYRRSLFVCIPVHSVVLEYDLRFGYWQPPQEFPVSRLAIIDDRLCGHSSTSNETYVLFEGYNDLGAPVEYIAAFGYDNFGSRFSLKNFDETATETYLSRNTVLTKRVLYDYLGATDIREFDIDGADTSITFAPVATGALGQEPLGSEPLGTVGEEIPDIVKARVIHQTSRLDFFERQVVFRAEGADIRFALIAFGENAQMSDNEANFIKQ